MRKKEIKNEIDEIKKWEKKIKPTYLKNDQKKKKKKKQIYDFQQYEKIRSFGNSIHTRKANVVKAKEDQSNLINNTIEFNNKSRPRSKEGKAKKRDIYESAYALYEGRELTVNTFKSVIFPINATKGRGLKTLTPR